MININGLASWPTAYRVLSWLAAMAFEKGVAITAARHVVASAINLTPSLQIVAGNVTLGS
ncbi:MAG: hypothetical protein H6632_12850 [Anaerolineales bacterium]|nr:hypothetical protein [Anaerolineales bacterium]